MNDVAIDIAGWAQQLALGDRGALARAITLVESQRAEDEVRADALLSALPGANAGQASTVRIGVTGVPGVGKSTFVDVLGMQLLQQGHRVAVLTVDPSSQKSGGSVLGDKTRMRALAADARAFVRSSPSRGNLGGVEAHTADSILLCEAAGFDVVMVETVGVGQSEIAVADLVDVVVWLALPGAGDELQGVKRGVMEVADVVVVHKADGERMAEARVAEQHLKAALMILSDNPVPVLLASSLEPASLEPVWQAIREKVAKHGSNGLYELRAQQRSRQFDAALTLLLFSEVRQSEAYRLAQGRASLGRAFYEARQLAHALLGKAEAT